MARVAPTIVLLLACLHEFAWPLFPIRLQGDVRSITQWPLTAALCAFVAALSRDGFTWSVAACVALMSSTTALCSVAWLIAPWPLVPGAEQCSAHWGVPMLLVSGLAALLVIAGRR